MPGLSAKGPRTDQGSITTLVSIAVLLVVILIACIGVNTVYSAQTSYQLQTATDAGALAGVKVLTKTNPTENDCNAAKRAAVAITAANEPPRGAMEGKSKLRVDITAQPGSNVRKLIVETTAPPANFFSRIVGWDSTDIRFRSVAGALRGLSSVDAGQLFPLALDLDAKCEGASELHDLRDKDEKHVVRFVSQDAPGAMSALNSFWLSTWGDESLRNGSDVKIGSVHKVQKSIPEHLLSSLKKGEIYNLPLVEGGSNDSEKRRIVGVIAFLIDEVRISDEESGSQKSIAVSGRIQKPVSISAKRGAPSLPLSNENQAFMDAWMPWQVALIE